jgi:hypothetical protein
MTAINTTGKGMLSVPVTGTTSTTGGAMCSVANPEGQTVYILRSYLVVTTASTGAANINVGVGASATTDASDMISALAINGAITDKIYNGNTIQATTKTEVTAPAAWTSDKFVNCTGSASSAGFTGTLFIEYIRA